MASYTAPTLHATADDLAVTDWNAVAGDVEWLYQVPYIIAYKSTAQSIASNATTQINIASTVASNYGFSISSNNIIVPLTGVYEAMGAAGLAANSNSGGVQMNIYQNGTFVISGNLAQTDAILPSISTGSGLLYCTAGDTVGLYLYQDIGGAADTQGGQQNQFLHMFFRGSQ